MKRNHWESNDHDVASKHHKTSTKTYSTDSLPSDTEAAFSYVYNIFPSQTYLSRPGHYLPPIIIKHQIYGLIHDKTTVDREIVALKDDLKFRLIKIETGQEDYALIEHSEYSSLIEASLAQPLCHKVTRMLQECTDVIISKQQLTNDFKMSSDEISELVQKGLLSLKDVGGSNHTWWFSIPGASSFIKDLSKGRAAMIRLIKRLKYKEILQSELEKKKLSVTSLPMEYHILDLVGSEHLESISTSSGQLLRLVE